MRVRPSVRGLLCLLLSAALQLPAISSLRAEDADSRSSRAVDTARGDRLVTEYFRRETERLTERTFAEIDSLEQWQQRRPEYRRQLFEMLGLDPLPEKTPLHAEVTGRVESEGVIVENLHFQSRPGLYVTANLYRPMESSAPLPAILYVCGHGRVKIDGVSYGNKTHYQHHGAWFARNGYVCLTIDTIQLGEIEGLHHGTYREKMWWWNNRGYTSAGAEAWNCIRAIDYLQSRPEVDDRRIGVTGRSGGGAYSWWVAALDERIQAAVPVAGITSLHNHVVDGCVEGHCDCMYMVNTYRWDYPMVAALVAPRPLLISNTDKDRIFPLDGVVDVHRKVRKIYDLYDAGDRLGLHITEGPHKDTQELRVHAFRWFNRFLKNDDSLIEIAATRLFEPEDLKVFDELPEDERVTTAHDWFVRAVSRDQLPESESQFAEQRQSWMESLATKTFRGWPSDRDRVAVDARVVSESRRGGMQIRKVEFNSQPPYRLAAYVIGDVSGETATTAKCNVVVELLDQAGWETLQPAFATLGDDDGEAGRDVEAGRDAEAGRPASSHDQASCDRAWKQIRRSVADSPDGIVVYGMPRGVGASQWSRDERTRTHIRRRFMQLGQTAAGMQIWDARRLLQAIDQLPGWGSCERTIHGSGESAFWALHASLWEPRIETLVLEDLPTSNRDAPDLLNVSRFVEIPQLLLMAAEHAERVRLRVDPANLAAWKSIADSTLAVAAEIEIDASASN